MTNEWISRVAIKSKFFILFAFCFLYKKLAPKFYFCGFIACFRFSISGIFCAKS